MPAVVCIGNKSKQIGFIAESTNAHPNEMSAIAYFMPRAMFICICTANKCINLWCICARSQMDCSLLQDNKVDSNMEVRCFTELPTF